MEERTYRRVFVIVVDSLGVGSSADAAEYHDEGADTLGHISQSVNMFHIPNLQKLGLANLHPLKQVKPIKKPLAYYTKMSERSRGKDTMTGHWEMMGLKTEKPFITFTDTGFPPELIAELERRTGHKVIGNKASSGTEILDELAEELYRCCEIARELTMRDEWKVGRVIARPYVGRKKGEFKRTSNRHDYAVKPFGRTALDGLKDKGLDVISVGKINDIFAGQGITEAFHSNSSVHGMEQTIELADRPFHGLCFVNLVDFDALWGHRRDSEGYARELERFDERLGVLLEKLGEHDILMITADHGNDPTYTGTDHTREKVPLLIYSKGFTGSGALPETDTFAAVGATAADLFGVEMPEGTIGESLREKLV